MHQFLLSLDKLSPPDPNCSSEGTLNRMPACSQPRRQLLKAQSVGSISSESLTVSSLWEAPSYDTIPDFLSSLGFDDFDSPELIPDRCVVPPPVPNHLPVCFTAVLCVRFIPPELDFVRPSLMRQATLGSVSTDSHLVEPLTPPDGTAATEDEVSSKPFFEGRSHSSACSVLLRKIMSHHRLLLFTCPPTHS